MSKYAVPPGPPHAYPRRILLMVTGRTPQVVTETVYALARQEPPFVPTEVHLITTAEGAQDANLALLAPGEDWFHKLVSDYQLGPIKFDASHIHTIVGADGTAVTDIRTRDEHEACADLITEMVRDFTADEDDTALHVSLAGGRKTMTYYLGNALTLFGRPQDRLSHVLVPPPYETNRSFFYPTPQSRPLYIEPLQRYFDAKDAVVTLAEIPFVRLRDSLPARFKGLAQGSVSFTGVVAAMQQALQPPAVTVDYGASALILANGAKVAMTGADLAFYGWLAERRRSRLAPVRIPKERVERWTAEDRAQYAGYLAEFQVQGRRTELREDVGLDMKAEKAMTYQFFHQRKTSIRSALAQAVGPLADAYEVRALVEGRPAGYGLEIEPERIRLVGDGPQ